MSNIKKFVIARDGWECRVEINMDFIFDNLSDGDKKYTMTDALKEMVLFWTGGKSRLENNGGNLIMTFLQQLGSKIQYIILEYNYNLEGVIDQFEEEEGYFSMNGSHGIRITSLDHLEIPDSEFEVNEEEPEDPNPIAADTGPEPNA